MSFVDGAWGSIEADREQLAKGVKFLEPGDLAVKLEVPCSTLSTILDKHNFCHMDILSIDVEGVEAEVLNGLDFDKYTPKWILVEVNKLNEIEKIILPKYELVDCLSRHDNLYRLRA
jgi:hypothetical protein